MPVYVDLTDLLEYTDWEREKWHVWFRQHGAPALQISVGPHGDGRFKVVGDVVRHVFSAEKRYVERLSGRVLTETASIPTDNVEALFDFGRKSREDLRTFVAALPAPDWDAPQEFAVGKSLASATPRKVVVHILMHAIRHWAQIATLLRLQGLTAEWHDWLMSPVMGGDSRREQPTR
jgi:uncharacterized damage-inducible protein DinB